MADDIYAVKFEHAPDFERFGVFPKFKKGISNLTGDYSKTVEDSSLTFPPFDFLTLFNPES